MTSDYYFLEDVGRFVDSAHRDRICHNRQQGSKSKVEWTSHAHVLLFGSLSPQYSQCTVFGSLTPQLHWVRSTAERRGTVVLLQPPGMSLHTINTSRTVWRGHRHVPLHFLCTRNMGFVSDL